MVKTSALGKALQMLLFCMAAALAWPNFQAGFRNAETRHMELVQFEQELKSGKNAAQLAKCHPRIFPGAKVLCRSIIMLRDAGAPAFRFVPDEPSEFNACRY
jgi:hypothetical protein